MCEAAGQRSVRECVTPLMTAFVTLAGVYSTPDFGGERSRDQDLMTTSRALDQFLSSVEKRAFKIAQLGLRNDDDALDAVQDSMMKLVQSYSSRDASRMAAPVLSHPRESHPRHAAAAHSARTHHGVAAGTRRGRRGGFRSDLRRRRATIRDPPGDSNSMKPSACSKRRWPTCHHASRRLSCCEISKVSTWAKRQAPWAARKAA